MLRPATLELPVLTACTNCQAGPVYTLCLAALPKDCLYTPKGLAAATPASALSTSAAAAAQAQLLPARGGGAGAEALSKRLCTALLGAVLEVGSVHLSDRNLR